MFERITMVFKAMIDALLGQPSDKSGHIDDADIERAISKANEILSKSTPDAALSIIERMENKFDEKDKRAGGILVGKAITQEGLTFDHEIHPDPDLEAMLLEEKARKLALEELGTPVAPDAFWVLTIIGLVMIAVIGGIASVWLKILH